MNYILIFKNTQREVYKNILSPKASIYQWPQLRGVKASQRFKLQALMEIF